MVDGAKKVVRIAGGFFFFFFFTSRAALLLLYIKTNLRPGKFYRYSVDHLNSLYMDM